jgi:alkaline phosphatase D
MIHNISVLLIFLLCSCAQVEKKTTTYRPENNFGLSIMQGHTTESMAFFRVIHPKHIKPIIKIKNLVNKISMYPYEIKTTTREHSIWAVTSFFVKYLLVGADYELQVTNKSSPYKWHDSRTFRALDREKKDFKFILASCISDTFNEIGSQAWNSALTHKPDAIFLIGDNVYADTHNGVYVGKSGDEKHLWNRYATTAMVTKLYRAKHLIPVYATWDDHDYGENNQNKNYKYKKQVLNIFKLFFAHDNVIEKSLEFGPGVSSFLTIGDHRFTFFDDRYFRDIEDSKTKQAGYHFGEKQIKWFEENLKKTKGQTWLISGDQYFGAHHPYESFAGHHPKKFKSFLSLLKKNKQHQFMFLSGDRHHVEGFALEKSILGYPSIEYTVSGMYSIVFEGALVNEKSERRIFGVDGTYNFSIFTLKDNGNEFRVFTEKNKKVIDHYFEIIK